MTKDSGGRSRLYLAEYALLVGGFVCWILLIALTCSGMFR